ncbi:MAG: hypothetical protein AB1679_03090 [Actinomycetota bacterium]|jgi:hypothetical protein
MTAQSRLAARVALAVGAVGGLVVVVAWFGASSSPIVRDQAGWGAVGVAGTFAVIAASILWVVTIRQTVALRAAELRAAIAAGAAYARPAAEASPSTGRREAPPPAAAEADLVAAPTMVHYHRAGCRLAAAKPVERAGRVEHERAGRTPCGVCEP